MKKVKVVREFGKLFLFMDFIHCWLKKSVTRVFRTLTQSLFFLNILQPQPKLFFFSIKQFFVIFKNYKLNKITIDYEQLLEIITLICKVECFCL